jgi:hypothetical protein
MLSSRIGLYETIFIQDLEHIYSGTEGKFDPADVFTNDLAIESETITDNVLQDLIITEVDEGTIGLVKAEPRIPREIMESILYLSTKYPWIGRLAIRSSGGISVAKFEQAVGNHAFDDAPLPYGISLAEGNTLRASMENHINLFRGVLNSLIK